MVAWGSYGTGSPVGLDTDDAYSGAWAEAGHRAFAGYSEHVQWVIVDPSPNDVRTSARAAVDLPAGARIEKAEFQITIDPPDRARIADVAEVRANPQPPLGDSSYTVDFAGLRTVSRLKLDVLAEVNDMFQWMGSGFADTPFYSKNISMVDITTAPDISFAEVMTERIRVDLRTTPTAEDILNGEVVIPTPPMSAEILVNGSRAWFSPIDATSPSTLADGDTQHSLAADVDLRDALQSALVADGAVEVELRASGPAVMSISSSELSFLRAHSVTFPDGPSRTIEATTEGTYLLDLPLDGNTGADEWAVQAVEIRARAEVDPPRVQPPVGPDLAPDIELVLAGERSLIVRLPADLLAPFAFVTGLRLPLRAGAGGGELMGDILTNDVEIDGPGTVREDVSFSPLTLDEGSAFDFVTFELAEPLEPVAGEDLWLELRVARGELAWALGEPAGGLTLPETHLRWRAPSGSARPLSAVADVAGMRGALRIVGSADVNTPIAALSIAVLGRAPAVLLTPVAAGTAVVVDLGPAATIQPADQGMSGVLRLELVVSAPGTYTFDSAVVLYRDPALDVAPV